MTTHPHVPTLAGASLPEGAKLSPRPPERAPPPNPMAARADGGVDRRKLTNEQRIAMGMAPRGRASVRQPAPPSPIAPVPDRVAALRGTLAILRAEREELDDAIDALEQLEQRWGARA